MNDKNKGKSEVQELLARIEELEAKNAALEESQEEHDRQAKADLEAARMLQVQDKDLTDVEREMRAQGHVRSTGFDTPHAAQQYQQSPYKVSDLGDPFLMQRKDPNRIYKQISFSKFRENGYRDIRGWIPLTQKNCTVEPFPEPDKEHGAKVSFDGYWHIQDRIWAFMPREQYAKIRQHIRNKTEIRTKNIGADFKEIGKKLGKKNLIIEDESHGGI